MDPEKLIAWEPVLRSQFAISLLLLAALIGALGWCFLLYRENQALNREFREHLRAQGDFRGLLEAAQGVIELSRESTHGSDREADRLG